MNGGTQNITTTTSSRSSTTEAQKPASRFGKRKQKRGKRTRSDGFVLGVELANSDDEDPYHPDPHGSLSSGPDPEALNFLLWIRNPTVQNLAKLRRAIKSNDGDWMLEFLGFDGLGLLFQCLHNLSSYQSSHLTDMVLRMECASCIREVVNSQSGLDCLLSIKSRNDNLFGRRFATALQTNNVMVKMQIVELLSALSLYSKDGFYLTLDALDKYKTWQKLPYRFSLLVSEFKRADLTTYRTAVMALINSIIVANENIRERVRIRNEFIALNLLDAIQTARFEDDSDLHVQLDVFEDELSADSDALEEMTTESTALNQPDTLFTALHKKVKDSPLAMSLLGVLYNLYQIDSSGPHSESIWLLVERLTREAVEGVSASEGEKLMAQARAMAAHRHEVATQTEGGDLTSPTSYGVGSGAKLPRRSAALGHSGRLGSQGASVSNGAESHSHPPTTAATMGIPPPPPHPPPPPPSGGGASPPPTPPPPPLSPGGTIPPPPPPPPPSSPGGHLCPPPPPQAPPLSPSGMPAPPPLPPLSPGGVQLRHVTPQQPEVKPIRTPSPSVKMKTFTWNKLPTTAVRQNSVWGDVSKMVDSISVEYDKLEELFSQKTSQEAEQDKADDNRVLKRQSATMEITLLDAKRSMNVNIFLKQFRKSNEAIVELIQKGDHRAVGSEKLKGLVKLLPQQDEVDLLQNFDGDRERLGSAERFFLILMELPAYKIRLDAMVAKADLPSQLSAIRPHISLFNSLCRRLYDNASLKKFLRFVLHTGNFINQGSNAGEACGFRLSSLNKLVMTKSNNPRMTLLHVLVEDAQQKDDKALSFVDDLLDDLQKASRVSSEGLKNEFTQVKNGVARLKSQLENIDEEVKNQFWDFIEESEGDLGDVDEGFERLSALSKRLATHFCENEKSFQLDEFLDNFRQFCERVKACEQEIDNRKQLAQKAEMRKKAQEEILEKRRSAVKSEGFLAPAGQDKKIVDNLVNEIKRGNVLRRLSMKRRTRQPESSHL